MSKYQKWQVLKVCTICKDSKTWDRGPWGAESKKRSSFQWHVHEKHPDRVQSWREVMGEIRRPTPRWQKGMEEAAEKGTTLDTENLGSEQEGGDSTKSKARSMRGLRKRKLQEDVNPIAPNSTSAHESATQLTPSKKKTKTTTTSTKSSNTKRKRVDPDKENHIAVPATKKQKSTRTAKVSRSIVEKVETDGKSSRTIHGDASNSELQLHSDEEPNGPISAGGVHIAQVTKHIELLPRVHQSRLVRIPAKKGAMRLRMKVLPLQPEYEEGVLIPDGDDLAALRGNYGPELQLLSRFAFGDYGDGPLMLANIAPQDMIEPRVIPYLISKARYFAGQGPIVSVADLEVPHKLTELFLRASPQIAQYTLEEDEFDRAVICGRLGLKAEALALAAFPGDEQEVTLWENDQVETKQTVKNLARYLLAKVRYFRSPITAEEAVANVEYGDGRWTAIPAVPLSYLLA